MPDIMRSLIFSKISDKILGYPLDIDNPVINSNNKKWDSVKSKYSFVESYYDYMNLPAHIVYVEIGAGNGWVFNNNIRYLKKMGHTVSAYNYDTEDYITCEMEYEYLSELSEIPAANLMICKMSLHHIKDDISAHLIADYLLIREHDCKYAFTHDLIVMEHFIYALLEGYMKSFHEYKSDCELYCRSKEEWRQVFLDCGYKTVTRKYRLFDAENYTSKYTELFTRK